MLPTVSTTMSGFWSGAVLEVVGRFGRQGRYAGQFHHVHSIAVDLSGNIYTAETQGKRVQRFVFEGLTSN